MSGGTDNSLPAQAQVPVDRRAADAEDLPDVGGLDPLGLVLVGTLHIPMLRSDLSPAGRPFAAATTIPARVGSASWSRSS